MKVNEVSPEASLEELEWAEITRSHGVAEYNGYTGFSGANLDMAPDADGHTILGRMSFRHDASVRVQIDADADADTSAALLRKIADHIEGHGVRPADSSGGHGWVVAHALHPWKKLTG